MQVHLPALVQPKEVLKRVEVENINKKPLKVGLDGLAVVVEQCEQQFGVSLSVVAELVDDLAVLCVKVEALLVVVLEVLHQEP